LHNPLYYLVPLPRFERGACGLGIRRSIRLSYRGNPMGRGCRLTRFAVSVNIRCPLKTHPGNRRFWRQRPMRRPRLSGPYRAASDNGKPSRSSAEDDAGVRHHTAVGGAQKRVDVDGLDPVLQFHDEGREGHNGFHQLPLIHRLGAPVSLE
jgi:hypothetical protein